MPCGWPGVHLKGAVLEQLDGQRSRRLVRPLVRPGHQGRRRSRSRTPNPGALPAARERLDETADTGLLVLTVAPPGSLAGVDSDDAVGALEGERTQAAVRIRAD